MSMHIATRIDRDVHIRLKKAYFQINFLKHIYL